MSDSFRVTLRRATLAHVNEVAGTTRQEQRLRHPGYRVKVSGDRLGLRYAGSGRTRAPWRMVARLEERSYGVVVTGRMRRTGAATGWMIVVALGSTLSAFGIALAVTQDAAHPGAWICLAGGPLLILVALLNLLLDSLAGFGDAAEARRLLRELFEPPEPELKAGPPRRGLRKRLLAHTAQGKNRAAAFP